MSVPYINYKQLEEFYTIKGACELFEISKSELKSACETHNVQPRRNEIGVYGFVKYDICRLHNLLYHEGRNRDCECMGGRSVGMNRLLSVKEVAALLQTSRVQVRRMIQSGELAALKVGREYRIPLEALQEFIRAALA